MKPIFTCFELITLVVFPFFPHPAKSAVQTRTVRSCVIFIGWPSSLSFKNRTIKLDYGRKKRLCFCNPCLVSSFRATFARKMTHDPLEIRHLRYFLEVAEAGSFSRAADRLGLSQPNISQQMRDLETTLRVNLFQRRGKRILLTSAGQIFQEHARAILHQIENFLQELTVE